MRHRPLASLRVLRHEEIASWLESNAHSIVALVRNIYLLHARGVVINPASCFLRFPNSERDRIIALPASIEDDDPISGLKWIASFPGNLDVGLYRASGVLILNDRQSGYPIACLEASAISAARTAASAIVGAHYLHPRGSWIRRLGVVGCGLISATTLKLFSQLGWRIDEIVVVDLNYERALRFVDEASAIYSNIRISDLEQVVKGSDLLLFATSATTPFVNERSWFRHNPTVLHMSLRDIGVDIILEAQNIADDVDACLNAQTSLHLAEQYCGNRAFISGGIAELIENDFSPIFSKTRIFSPFGLGALDLALGRAILRSGASG